MNPRRLHLLIFLIFTLSILGAAGGIGWVWFTHLPETVATLETAPVPNGGDAADDICIWIHPSVPEKSAIIGTDKHGGLAVYDLEGQELQYLKCGRMNNVDLRYGFPLGSRTITLVAATNRSSQSLDLFEFDETERKLKLRGSIATTLDVYGCSLFVSPRDPVFYAFVTSSDGQVQQYKLLTDRDGEIVATLVRTIPMAGKIEGCVADDELGFLYLADEQAGVFKIRADPGIDDGWRQEVCVMMHYSKFWPDAEGLTIYYGPKRTGYLLLSCQGNSSFAVFRREGDNDYLGSFRIGRGAIDSVSHTDGIDVTNVALGPNFPKGLFVVQDDRNDNGNQNFKLVRWDAVAKLLPPPVLTESTWDPRTRTFPAPVITP